MRIQLWSYNYDPEPTGIAPVSKVWAEGLRDRGHEVDVVAAHPHYPSPEWGRRVRPYREVRNGIPLLRLPLWVGRASAAERYRQELTFMAAQFAALPALSRPDVLVSASPSFPALLPAIVNSRSRRIPWLLWLHDILPDGAASTGIVESGLVLEAARRLERAAYRQADRIVVLSESFTRNLVGKGVPEEKIRRVYLPATRVPGRFSDLKRETTHLRLLSMGNVGHSQGLASLVHAFERSAALTDVDVRFVITGNGVAADDVRREIRTGRVEMAGVVDDARLEQELQNANVAFVSQHYDGAEFNIPSKLMNFMAYGLPVLAAVNPSSEVARLVEQSGGGWVVNSGQPHSFPEKLAEVARDPEDLRRRGEAARAYAQENFSQVGFTARFERVLDETLAQASR
jgi:colanic acid biosynthesis glycosyl transferase WcaI